MVFYGGMVFGALALLLYGYGAKLPIPNLLDVFPQHWRWDSLSAALAVSWPAAAGEICALNPSNSVMFPHQPYRGRFKLSRLSLARGSRFQFNFQLAQAPTSNIGNLV